MKFFATIDRIIEKVSSGALIFCVASMLSLSVLNIILRWFGTTIHWVEPFVRHMVFLSAFLGGVVATGRGTHIGIDILGKYFESREMLKAHKVIKQVIACASFLVLIWLFKSSWDFMKVELEFGKPVFWGISSGYLVGIIPFGFSLICYRFFFLLLNSFFGSDQQQETA